MRTETKKIQKSWLDWLEISALLAGLIASAGLILLLSYGAHAEPPSGFGAGPKYQPFANPGVRPPSNNFFEDEDEDEDFYQLDERPPTPPSGSRFGQTGNPSFPTASSPTGSASSTGANRPSGISMGGGAAGNVIPGSNIPPISLDSETGDGSKETVTDFNFPDADIMDIAKTLGRLTGKNFILDKDVKGRVTIISNSPITVGDAWRAFLTALDINGFALIPSGKYIRIARQRDARDKQLRAYTGDQSPDTDALITRVFQLKYINSEEVARTFRSFMPANSRIIPYEQTNTVIVTDTGSNIAKLQKMLDLLDVEGFDAGIEVIPVKYASAQELAKLIDQLLPSAGSVPGAGPGAPRFGGGGGGRFNARRTKEGGILNTIIPDDRTNTLIVHANTKGADQVRELVAKLDQKMPAPQGGGKVHVVYLQYADAEQIATTLNNLSSQSAAASRPTTVSGLGGTGVNPVQASLFEGSIKISADKPTNSLVITASPGDFVTVQRVINRLDIPRDEVYVEVVIMEVAITREFEYGASALVPKTGVGLATNADIFDLLTNPIAPQKGAIFAFKTGSETININGTTKVVPNVQSLIKLIQSNSNSNILATPQIIALDNTEANFESTDRIPVPTTTQVQGVGSSTSITKDPVTLSIKIKPQINKVLNFVKLDIESKLGDISGRAPPQQVAGLAFTTSDRIAKTTVVVGDADTIVLGGLMRDKVNETQTKIPILGDIPLLGWLFRSSNTKKEKSNLLIFLTPHIIRQYEKVRALLDKKLQERDEFLERNAGGSDPMRPYRDDIIRRLPDVKELTAKRANTTVTLDEERTAGAADNSNASPFSGKDPNTASESPPPQQPAMPVNPNPPPTNELPALPPPADPMGGPKT